MSVSSTLFYIIIPLMAELVSICYLAYHVQSMWFNQDDNIMSRWKRYLALSKGDSRLDYFYTQFYFPASGNLNSLLYQTITLISLILLSIVVVPIIWHRRPRVSLNHISPPRIYQSGNDIKHWLELFELYIDAHNISDDKQKCNALISRLDCETNVLIRGYIRDDNASSPLRASRYPKLKSALINFYDKKEISPSVGLIQFAQRQQLPSENVHKYYAHLNNLCYVPYRSLTKYDRNQLVNRRFVDGLLNDNLRMRLLELLESNPNTDVLVSAQKLSKFCVDRPSSNATINHVQFRAQNKSPVEYFKPLTVHAFSNERMCRSCGVRGHLSKFCPLAYTARRTHYPNVNMEKGVDLSIECISRVRELNGFCLVDNHPCDYLLDTGAGRTVIRENMIPLERRNEIIPLKGSVFTFDGNLSPILGIKNCTLQIGNTFCKGDFLVARQLIKDCLLGMDVLTSCPLFKEAITSLHTSIKSLISYDYSPDTQSDTPENACYESRLVVYNPGQNKQDIVNTHINNVTIVPVVKDDIIEILKSYFHDITASCMEDLTVKTNTARTVEIKHIMEIEPNTLPIKQKTRGVPYSFREEFNKTVEEMYQAGLIVPSKSPWCSPVRLVKKKDGTVRVCVDYRKVNNVTIKDAYPIPKIEDLFSYLGNAKIFTTLDLASGYYQVKLDKESQQYTAFSCEFGFYEYTVMPMGLTNACATFQRLMNSVLDGLLGKICLVYLDDIIIYSNSDEEHKTHVNMVADRLRENNLKVKLSKCHFAREQVEYLSHIISNGSLRTNPEKTSAVSSFKVPTNVKQMQSFLGFVSYYRKFIPNCAKLCSPLIHLTTKYVPFEWTDGCQTAFDTLKQILVQEENILIIPNHTDPFRVETDASKYGVGGVLSQFKENQWRPVAYFSKHLSKTESNYSATEREMLAIVLSVERFKQYLYGRTFSILSDHQPLKYMLTTDIPERRLARLLNRLGIFQYNIIYRAGKFNGNADGLSRMVDENEHRSNDLCSEEDIVINAIHLKSDKMNCEQLQDLDLKWFYELKRSAKASGVKPIIKEFDNKVKRSLYSQWSRIYIFNQNLFREYIDDDDNICYQYIVPMKQRNYILYQLHDCPTAGHLGFEKTRDRIITRFYWYGQLLDIKNYIQSCTICQQAKSSPINSSPLIPILPTRPSQIITTDIMGPLPKSNTGYLYVLVVVDHFTKWVELFPMTTIRAVDVAEKLMSVFLRHGIPDTILSDQGSNYQSELLGELYELLDMHKVRTTPYHPQCDGLTERFNRTIQAMLTGYVSDDQKNWDLFLPTLAFAYNTAVHSTTKSSPFELTYGRKPKIPIDLIFSQLDVNLLLSPESYANNVKDNFHKAFDLVIKTRDLNMNRQKVIYDRKVRAAKFELHDLVWLLDTAKKPGKSLKLSRKWVGPYKILSVINKNTIEIQSIKKRSRKVIVNSNRLTKCFTRDYKNVADPVLYVPVDGNTAEPVLYEPEADIILDHLDNTLSVINEDDEWPVSLAKSTSTLSNLTLRTEKSLSDRLDPLRIVPEISLTESDSVPNNDELIIENSTNHSKVQASNEDLLENNSDVDKSYMINRYFKEQLDNEPVNLRKSNRERKNIVRFGS